jgi:hypothetical protein
LIWRHLDAGRDTSVLAAGAKRLLTASNATNAELGRCAQAMPGIFALDVFHDDGRRSAVFFPFLPEREVLGRW